MLTHAGFVLVFALPVLTAAVIFPRQSNQCNTGVLQCCEVVECAGSDPTVSELLGLLGVTSAQIGTELIGVTCSPIIVIAAGGASCSAQPVCCTDNSFNGIVAIGCTPFDVNL